VTNVISLTFGYEEVLFLIHLLRIPPLSGLDEDPLAGTPAEQVNAAMVGAERALRARGFIQVAPGEQPAAVYSPVIALLASCATAETTLLVTAETGDQPLEARYYHVTQHLAVERSFPQPGLHCFTGGPEFDGVSWRLLEFLHLDHQPQPDGSAGSISQAILEEARSVASSDRLAAVTILQSSGLTETTAQVLAEALGNPVCIGMVSAVYSDPQRDPQGLGVVVAHRGVWLITSKEEDGELGIFPVSGEEAAKRILATVN
jgi:hypothetical protein